MNTITDAIFATNTIGNIRALDLKCGTELMHYNSGVIKPKCLNIMQNDYVLAVEEGPLIYAWQLNSSEKLQTIRMLCPGKIGCFSSSPDGLYISVSIDNKLLVWQTSTGKLLNTATAHYQPISVVRWTQDSSDIVTGGEDGLVCVWRLSHLAMTNYMYLGVVSSKFSKSQVTPRYTFSDHSIKITDLYVGFGELKARLFTASDDKTCKIYSLESGCQLVSIVFDSRPTSIIVDIPENNFFVGTADGSIKVVSLLDPPRNLEHHFEENRSTVFAGHTKSITCLALSTDESTLVSGSKDETIKLWYVASRQCLQTISMRAVVTNVIVKNISKAFNSPDFQTKCVLRDFQKSYDQNTAETLELHCPDNLFTSSSSESSDSEDEAAALREKVKTLTRINEELFNFATSHTLKTNISSSVKSGEKSDNSRAKRKRIKIKKSK